MAGSTPKLDEAWVLVQGLPVFYRTSARFHPPETPVIIHLHGFAISGTYLLPTASELADDFRTYVPDLPGFGRSVEPDSHLEIADLADCVLGFMDALGIEQATLLGNSMGCIVATEFADRYAHRLDRVILVSPAGGRYNQPLVKGLLQLGLDALREPIRMFPIASIDYLRFGLLDVLRLFRSMIDYPATEKFQTTTPPALIVIGGRDPMVQESNLVAAARKRSAISVVRVDAAAHAMNFSHPQTLAALVRRYLRGDRLVEDHDSELSLLVDSQVAH